MRDNIPIIISFAAVLVVISLFVNVNYTDAQSSEQSTSSNATVNNYVAIALSTNLSTGIEFGSLDPDTGNNNATGNYDAGPEGDGGTHVRNSSYYIVVSTDSNSNVDFCIKDETALNTSGDDWLLNGNYTWNDNSTSNTTEDNSTDHHFTLDYVPTNVTAVTPGSQNFFKFYLDIPASQPAGVYNNTVYIKGIVTGASC